jgi:hypothetical protein
MIIIKTKYQFMILQTIRNFGILLLIYILSSCTNTRYLTDSTSIGRQHDMLNHRTGRNLGDVCKYFVYSCISEITDSEEDFHPSERAFKRITVINQSIDSLYINMVTDVVWKESGYCDIMGISLPPGAKQKLLAPYPAAYNVFFRTPNSEEEKLEIRTDNNHRRIVLRPGMTKWLEENEK